MYMQIEKSGKGVALVKVWPAHVDGQLQQHGPCLAYQLTCGNAPSYPQAARLQSDLSFLEKENEVLFGDLCAKVRMPCKPSTPGPHRCIHGQGSAQSMSPKQPTQHAHFSC